MSNERRLTPGDFLWKAIGQPRDAPPSPEQYGQWMLDHWQKFCDADPDDEAGRSIEALDVLWSLGGQIAHLLGSSAAQTDGTHPDHTEVIPVPRWVVIQLATAYFHYREGNKKSLDEALGLRGRGRSGGGREIDRRLKRRRDRNLAADVGALEGAGEARSTRAAVSKVAAAVGIEADALQKVVATQSQAREVGAHAGRGSKKSRLNSTD